MPNQKIRVGIITYHFPYNCGAVLQCLALQTKLEELGYEVCVINYRPWYHQNRYTPLKNPFYYACKRFRDPAKDFFNRMKHAIGGFLRAMYSWREYKKISVKEKMFRTFLQKNIKETKVYRSLKELQRNPPDCDVYIAGSDQLWNCNLTEGTFDSAYFLDFGGDNVGRMTYSVGTNFDNLQSPETVLRALVRNLDVISLRETKWLPTVEAASGGEMPVHIDVDPTLLLTAERYAPFMAPVPEKSEPYILTYTMAGKAQEQVYSGARILSEKLGIKVMDVCGDPNQWNKSVADNRLCGPGEFLSYIKNAEYVITNSFHGTVFSILFRKKFITIPHVQTGNRVTELLDKLGISQRYQSMTINAVAEITNEIDYQKVMEKLETLRTDSVEFLKEIVEKYSYKEAVAPCIRK